MQISIVSFLNIPYHQQVETRHWRNSSHVAKFFKIPYISEEIHLKWLDSLKDTPPKNIAFLIMVNTKPVGVTYFHSVDYNQKKADWGIYLYDETIRGKGIGNFALNFCISFAKNNLHMETLYLDVLYTNIRAISLYEKFGFKKIEHNDIWLRYVKKL